MVFPSRRAQVIDKSNIGDFEDSLKTEVDVMKSVQHRNIICMKEIFDSSDKLYIVLELVRSPKLVCSRWGTYFDRFRLAGNGRRAVRPDRVEGIVFRKGTSPPASRSQPVPSPSQEWAPFVRPGSPTAHRAMTRAVGPSVSLGIHIRGSQSRANANAPFGIPCRIEYPTARGIPCRSGFVRLM